jgi:hypothetical protein
MLLNARGDVWLRGNRLNAPLTLYGPPSPIGGPLGLDDLLKLREKQKSLGFPANLRRGLWISDNQLDRIALSGEIEATIRSAINSPSGGVVSLPEVHAITVFANNHVESLFTNILARTVTLSGNSFEQRTPPTGVRLYAAVLADAASLVGNVVSGTTNGVDKLAAFSSRGGIKEAANVMSVQIV